MEVKVTVKLFKLKIEEPVGGKFEFTVTMGRRIKKYYLSIVFLYFLLLDKRHVRHHVIYKYHISRLTNSKIFVFYKSLEIFLCNL